MFCTWIRKHIHSTIHTLQHTATHCNTLPHNNHSGCARGGLSLDQQRCFPPAGVMLGYRQVRFLKSPQKFSKVNITKVRRISQGNFCRHAWLSSGSISPKSIFLKSAEIPQSQSLISPPKFSEQLLRTRLAIVKLNLSKVYSFNLSKSEQTLEF